MSNPQRPNQYDPLPLTHDDGHIPYNSPPSPDPNITSFNTPQMTHAALPGGAAQPRFMGAARHDNSSSRDSYASSHSGYPGQNGSEYSSSVYALNTPAPLSGYRDDPQDNYLAEQQNAVPMQPVGATGRYREEKNAAYAAPRTKSKRKVLLIAIVISAILLILAVIIPVYFAIVRPKMNNSTSNSHSSGDENESSTTGSARPTSTSRPGVNVTGGDGSQITMEDGTKFTYKNSFGGYWYYDENDPFNNGARAQSWTPALNETFRYGTDLIRGVNLGGWLVTEPFISPALYEQYINDPDPAVDEYTLSLKMRADTARGGINQLENHYKTFITEEDFADIAGAGLNTVRIPIGYWAIETRGDEPFLEGVSWTYFLKAIKWARKYGLHINIDFHALPGSQNGWNHSGRLGEINFLNGPMGYANAQRALDYMRIIAEFVSQPQYRDVVTIFGIINEPRGSFMGFENLASFYTEAYKVVREASGVGEGNGPYISFHDGFFARSQWVDFIPNGDRMTLDTHPYLAFNDQPTQGMEAFVNEPCGAWGSLVNQSSRAFGLTNAGEWSNAVTDCGLWLNGVNLGIRYEGTFNDGGSWPSRGSCDVWTDYQNYTPETKAAILQFSLSTMDALQNFFFWTWKIGPSSRSGKIETPAWSYQLGLQEGWMPKDTRDAIGTCGGIDPFVGPLQSWQTGGAGAGDIPPGATDAIAWPPAVLSNAGAITLLPSYTATGPIPTLPGPSFSASIDVGNGWANTADTQLMHVPIPTCNYLDPWVGPNELPPSPLCGAARRSINDPPAPTITLAP